MEHIDIFLRGAVAHLGGAVGGNEDSRHLVAKRARNVATASSPFSWLAQMIVGENDIRREFKPVE